MPQSDNERHEDRRKDNDTQNSFLLQGTGKHSAAWTTLHGRNVKPAKRRVAIDGKVRSCSGSGTTPVSPAALNP
jgi:hypothetical protein